jgi:hypothetical protein
MNYDSPETRVVLDSGDKPAETLLERIYRVWKEHCNHKHESKTFQGLGGSIGLLAAAMTFFLIFFVIGLMNLFNPLAPTATAAQRLAIRWISDSEEQNSTGLTHGRHHETI